MKIVVRLCVALLLAGTAPLSAQTCGDDIAGLAVDDEGNYVIKTPAARPAPGTVNMTRLPQSRGMAISPKPTMSVPAVSGSKAAGEAVGPAPAEDAAADADREIGDPQGKTTNSPAPNAALAAPFRVAQAQTGTTSPDTAQPAGTASIAKPKKTKKSSGEPARKSGAAIVKEGGKTCSGLDEYRVCW